MCGLTVLKRLPINFSFAWKFPLCPSRQASAAPLCPSAWSGESSRARDMQLISVARGVMSSWSRRPTTAAPTTRSAMLTRSRWRTSTATSPMPTRLYHKGKTRGKRRDLISRAWPGAEDASSSMAHKKTQKHFHTPCFYCHLHTGEFTDTFFLISLHSFIKSILWRRLDAQKSGSLIRFLTGRNWHPWAGALRASCALFDS